MNALDVAAILITCLIFNDPVRWKPYTCKQYELNNLPTVYLQMTEINLKQLLVTKCSTKIMFIYLENWTHVMTVHHNCVKCTRKWAAAWLESEIICPPSFYIFTLHCAYILMICDGKRPWRSLRSESVVLSLYVGKKLNECKTLLEKLMEIQITCVKNSLFF